MLEWRNRKCRIPGLIIRWSTDTPKGTELWVHQGNDNIYRWDFTPTIVGSASSKQEAQLRCEQVAETIEEFASRVQALTHLVRFVVDDTEEGEEEAEVVAFDSLQDVEQYLWGCLSSADYQLSEVTITGYDRDGKEYDVPAKLGIQFGTPEPTMVIDGTTGEIIDEKE